MGEAHITLYGGNADRFEEIQEALAEAHGMPYGRAQTVRWLMANADLPDDRANRARRQ